MTCYICDPDNPEADDEGCRECDSEQLRAVIEWYGATLDARQSDLRRQAVKPSRTFMYRITRSAVPTVEVGSYLVDEEDGLPSEWGAHRWWSTWCEEAGEFRDGWSADRLDRLCTRCRRQFKVAALHGHAEACGAAPKVIPA